MHITTKNNANKTNRSHATGIQESAQRQIPAWKMKAGDFKSLPISTNIGNSSNELLARGLFEGYEYLKPSLQTVSLRAGQELFAQGEENEYVYFPETCVVSHLYNLADGSAIEVAMVGNEGVSGLCSIFGSSPNKHQARTTIGGNARRVDVKSLNRAFLSGGQLQKMLLDYFSLYLGQISQRVVCESFHPVEQRFCSWLLMINDRTQTNQLPITHEQISLNLGVQRSTISLIANHLRESGLIDYTRGKCVISDRTGLEAVACECYDGTEHFQ